MKNILKRLFKKEKSLKRKECIIDNIALVIWH